MRYEADIPVLPAGTARPQAALAPAGGSGRIVWLDCAKGIGIILVVIGHAVGGMIDFKAMTPAPWLIQLFFAIYVFHMPLFFFLTALLIDARVRKDRVAFATSIGQRIVYPYFLWSFIQLTIMFFATTLVNTPLDSYWANVAAIPYAPGSQFWFLYALAILHVAALLLLPIMPRTVFLGVMVAFWLLGSTVALPLPVERAAQYALYYGLGIAIGPQVGVFVARLRGWPVVALAVLFGLALLAVVAVQLGPVLQGIRLNAGMIASIAWRTGLTPLALLGALIVMILAASAKGAVARWLGLLGRASMTIYLTHVIPIAGSRILIAHVIGPIDPLSLLLILVMIGIGGPLLARAIARRLSVARLFALD